LNKALTAVDRRGCEPRLRLLEMLLHVLDAATPGTSTAHFLLGLQARGMDAVSASHVAIVDVVHLIQRQAYSLALQDGYRFTFFMLIPAILAVLFVRNPRVTRTRENKGESAAEEGYEPHPYRSKMMRA